MRASGINVTDNCDTKAMQNSQFLIVVVFLMLITGFATYLVTNRKNRSVSSPENTLTPEQIRSIVGDAAREHLVAAQQTLREETDSRLTQNLNALNMSNQQASTNLTQLVKPLTESLQTLGRQVSEIEKARAEAFTKIETQTAHTTNLLNTLQTETTTLSNALTRNDTRGRWGELQVRRILELAQLTEGIHFDEQKQEQGEGTGRPDFTIYLTNNRVLYIDSKAPMSSYLDALQESDVARRDALFSAHAKALKTHVTALSKRDYLKSAESLDFVIMFIPTESSLAAACEANPQLLEEAAASKILLASPVSLMAILCNVMMLWQQDTQNKNAEEIAETATKLHSRLKVFMGHFAKVGESINRAGKAYDEAIGSFDRHVEPQARKVAQLSGMTDVIETPEPISISVRQSTKIQTIDLVDGHEDPEAL